MPHPISPTVLLEAVTAAPAEPQELKKAVSHFAEFFDASFPRLYGYLFWSSGSVEIAEDLASGVYFDIAKKSRRLFARPELTMTTLLGIADQSLHLLRKKGQGTTVEFSLLESIERQCPALAKIPAQDLEVKRREIAGFLQDLLALPDTERKALILAGLMQWNEKETAYLLGMREEKLLSLLATARGRFAPAILSLLQFTPVSASESLQRIRIGVVEQCSHLRTSQVRLMVVLGAGAVIANALVSTVVAFAVVSDPLKPLQEKTRPQLAAIDAQLVEERIGTLHARIELSALRADADAIYVKEQVKDHLVAYGLLTVQEEVERRSGGLAFLEPVKQLLVAVLEFMRGELL